MQIYILPLLAALQHYTPNDDTWRNGLEVTYKMTWNTIINLPEIFTITEDKILKSATSNFIAKMKCQVDPNDLEHMQCSVTEPYITVTMQYTNESTTEKTNITGMSKKAIEFFQKHYLFDVKFDKSGIHDLLAAPILDDHFDGVRTIAYPLHAVIDLDNLTSRTFEASDKFWTGNCNTKYEVMMTHGGIGNQAPVKKGQWETGKSIIINKRRDMGRCPSRVDYLPPSTKMSGLAMPNMELEIKLSESHIVADNTKFISMTRFDGIIHSKDRNDIKANITEDIKLEYVSAAPVTKKIVTHGDLKSIGLVFGKK